MGPTFDEPDLHFDESEKEVNVAPGESSSVINGTERAP